MWCGGCASGFVASYTVGNTTYSYTYDRMGNITQIDVNDDVRRLYTYDTLGQLIREYVYPATGSVQQYQYSYDKSGNITQAIHSVGSSNTTYNYTYGNQNWGDLLTNYNGTAITYDTIGNPLKWRNAAAIEWSGRQLSNFGHNDGTITGYSYNADGIRTKKTVFDTGGSVISRTNYTLDGSKIVAESRNGTNIYYLYDDTGAIMGISYGYNTYTFAKNIQGDVIGIYSGGGLVAKYEYNAYGQILSITNASGADISNNASHIANINPFRYRGYYYDTETGFYYLQSRYYDPVVGRFLNADAFVSTGQGILGNNMFAYCLNNFVNRIDESGCWSLKNIFKAVATVAVTAVVAVAVVAAAPVVASVAAATATAVGAAAIATTASTVATASCVAVAASTVAIGVNEAIDTMSGYNCGEELLGKETYQTVECVTNTAAMLITMAPQAMPYPSSGRYEPNNLNEQVAMNLSKSAPRDGKVIISSLSDSKHPGVLGWQKYSHFFPAEDGNIEIHYVGNKYFPCYFDFKFKEKPNVD